MTTLMRALPTLFKVSVARHVAYRAEMTIWILTALLPLIMLALWSAVVAEGSIMGFGEAEVTRYFVATLICRQLTGAWVVWELSFQIRTGGLSAQLLRPVHPLYVYAVWMISAWPFRLAILSPILAMIALWRPDMFLMPDAASLVLFALSIVLAWLLNFLIQCAIGLSSFWVDKADGLYGVWLAVWSICSGYIAPLAMFPEWAQRVLNVLPFRAILATPVEILGGFVTAEHALPLIGIQIIWLVAAAGLVRWMWIRGLQRYGAWGS
ncbi:MAG: ABC transporter permease [Myxococcota bacterium]